MRLDLDAVRQRLGEKLFSYVTGRPRDMPLGAEDPNEAAITRYRIVPRVMTGQAGIDTRTPFLGYEAAAPLIVGAFAADRIIATEGILPIARASAALRIPLVVSEECLTPLAEITAVHDHAFLQLRAAGPVERALALIGQAADEGAKGIVMTLLAPVHPRPGFHPGGIDIAREITDRGLATIGARDGVAHLPAFPTWGWSELAQVAAGASARGLPLVAKGILHGDDARAALEAGCAAIMVSNIGVRQLYRWAPAVDCLAGIRQACGEGATLILDGGVRNGGDAVVAAALGASLVSIVRPVIYALVQGGETGVRDYLSGLIDDIATIASWAGAGKPGDLSLGHLVRL